MGDKLLLMSERGKLRLVRVTRDQFQVLGEAEVLEGEEMWATPLLYGGRVFVKGIAELVCLDWGP